MLTITPPMRFYMSQTQINAICSLTPNQQFYGNNKFIFNEMMTRSLVGLFVANHIGGVMVSMLASSAVDRGFEPQSGQTKDYEIDICCFSAKNALRSKSKD
jgi:hypothetical protein